MNEATCQQDLMPIATMTVTNTNGKLRCRYALIDVALGPKANLG